MPKLTTGDRPPGRNDPCPCGSGLKFKKCHGDQAKVSMCRLLARHMFTLLVLDARMQAGNIEAEDHERLTSGLKEAMIEMIVGKDEEPEMEPGSRNLGALQAGLERCSTCGGMFSAGTECMKCKNKG